MNFNHGCRARLSVRARSLVVFVAGVLALLVPSRPGPARPSCGFPQPGWEHGANAVQGGFPGPDHDGCCCAARHQLAEFKRCQGQEPVPQVTGGSSPSHQAGLLPVFIPISLGAETRAGAQAGPRAAAPRDGDLDGS